LEVMTALYTSVLLVMIVSTMLVAGLSSNASAIGKTLRNLELVGLVALCNLIVVPLIGWGVAEALSLSTSGYVALILVACSPGAPFGVKLILAQKGDLVKGSTMQVALAAVGSVTFALTANAIFSSSGTGDISLPVGDLIKTVVVLQLIPFGVGLMLNTWTPETAEEWRPYALRASALSFPAVLVLAMLGSWEQLVDLLGSSVLLAAALFSALSFGAGMLFSPGPMLTRTTMAAVAPMRNAGPVMAAVGVAFGNDPAILAAVTGVALVSLVVALCLNTYVAKSRAEESTAATGAETVERPAALGLVPPQRPNEDARRAA
jgi:BASS family bile acid:Na+ symporter